MGQYNYLDALNRIKKEEQDIRLNAENVIGESYRMVNFLRNILSELKASVLKQGFSDSQEEIEFFKQIKPEILGKLVFYNKVSRVESACPANNGSLFHIYFSHQLEKLNNEYEEYVSKSEFYRYYRSGRTDRDEVFFRLGKINYYQGLNSFVFEIDAQFSTYYDYKIARIIANDLLYVYLHSKIEPDDYDTIFLPDSPIENRGIYWTESKNALIELIYALHVSGCISNGRLGLRKTSLIFQEIFKIQLGDIHHAFHRMKDRVDERSIFLNYLKSSLEKYMDKNL